MTILAQVEKLIIEIMEMILEARGFDGEILLLPQRELRARDLLRDGRVPDEVIERVITSFDRATLVILGHAAMDLKDQRMAAVKREREAACVEVCLGADTDRGQI